MATSPTESKVASRPAATTDLRQQRRLAEELDAALNENLKLRRAAESNQTQSSGIAGRVAVLKDVLQRLPEQQIPQLSYATEADWYAAVDGKLETAEDFRIALARLRTLAEARFAKILLPALNAYLAANQNTFPSDVSQLGAFFTESVEPAALQHYQIVRANEIRSVKVGGEWAITQASLIDSEFDSHVVIGPSGYGSYGGRRSR